MAISSDSRYQDADRVFERFYRGGNSASPGVGGVGLGLSICRDFVERHGGEIWAEAPADGGAIFAFTLSWNEFIYALTFISSIFVPIATFPAGLEVDGRQRGDGFGRTQDNRKSGSSRRIVAELVAR